MTQIVALQEREEVLRHVQKVRQSFHIRAPELPVQYPWLNVARPLSPDDLRGKIVLLDFWTGGGINCIHVQDDLKYLAEKYADQPFLVIGVHSAKYDHERGTDSVRQAVLRYGIEYPVVVDQNFALWQAYAVHAWPTFVLLDPEGNITAVFSGEGNRQGLDLYIDVVLEQFRSESLALNASPVPMALEKDKFPRPDSPLSFPGKILADPDRERLYIADTNHHRILVTDFDGRVIDTIGGGRPGLVNGAFALARFRRPHGLALYHDRLLVADTDNHTIRQVDFTTRQVRTLAGTGREGHLHQASGYAPHIPLNSPWDLAVAAGKCYIAMAGAHQIWMLDLELLTVEPFAGTGREDRADGPRKKAAFAQPTGIATDSQGKNLYVADSETGSVRRIDLTQNGHVSTLVGGDLFDFGDEDGPGPHARLQHPMAVLWFDDKIFLADTFNHKIKVIDPKSGYIRSYLGGGSPGLRDGLAPQFYEPSGLGACHNRLFVADTNNHAIRVIDLHVHRVDTLDIQGEEAGESSPEPLWTLLAAGGPKTTY